MDVPKYKIIFRKPSESDLHFYKRCKKIKADEKLSGYLIYTPFKSIATKYPAGCRYLILMKGPRAKSDEFFKSREYEKHAAEFVEKVKAMDPVCVRYDGVYCEDGVHYQEEAALYYDSNAIKSMHDFRAYCNYDGAAVTVSKAHMDSAHWVKYLLDDSQYHYYMALCCPRIRISFPEFELHDIDHDRWFSYMRNCYALEKRQIKAAEERIREYTSNLDRRRCNIARIYDQFTDSEKLMVELDMG